jgi:hypothetical protein
MRAQLLATLVLGGCGGNPVEDCPSFPRTDCCETHSQCFEFYGGDFPICTHPNQEDGGKCEECGKNTDCKAYEVCLDGQCIDPQGCYEGTPWPATTACR